MAVVIVDYDVGNLRSVQKAFEKVGAPARVSRRPEEILA
ncbi:MAG: imidazole glycerol phosphate synthase subunit HisH, partial [Nitrospinota bacterium]|nr:imidazole glycerol phosphate synthase subunit HisH [Nitrospinota bacterium]